MMILARKNLVNFISEEGIVHDTLEAHRWMELSQRICQLFDHAHYFVMRGYEEYYPQSEEKSEGWVNRVMHIFNVGGNPFGQTAETVDATLKK